MNAARRGRSLSVLMMLLAGGIGIVSSTQTWLTVIRRDGGPPIEVPGADALPLLAPLSLAVLALGAALTITGLVLRYVFGVLALGAAVLLITMTLPVILAPPLSAVAPSVTEATGLAGTAALEQVVAQITPGAWPAIALAGWAVLLAGSVFALATARSWRRGGSRFQTAAATTRAGAAADDAGAEEPIDAVDSWDDLSRGTDPTR